MKENNILKDITRQIENINEFFGFLNYVHEKNKQYHREFVKAIE